MHFDATWQLDRHCYSL